MKKSIPGLLFIVASLLCGMAGLCVSSSRAIEVSRLEPVTASALLGGAVSPGDKVLVEGYISEENEVVYPEGNFVAYLYERRKISTDDDGRIKVGSWRKVDEVTPPLLLELTDGMVQVENDDYTIENLRTIEGPKMWVPGSHTRYSKTRYRGIAVGDRVIAVGTAQVGDGTPHIRADFVARGTREEYIAGQRTGGLFSCCGSLLVGLIGGAILLQEQIKHLFHR